MKLEELVTLLDAKVFTKQTYDPNFKVNFAFSCDLMSDALMMLRNVPMTFCDEGILSTGLVTIQGVRTAEMLDLKVILLVRDKVPTDQVIQAAEETGIIMIGTSYTMFSANGRMYASGIKGISEL